MKGSAARAMERSEAHAGAIPDGARRRMQRAAIAFGVAVAAVVTHGDAMAIETLPYRVIERDGHFELRRIESHVVAETIVEGRFEDVGNEGFRRLVRYIGGNNRRRSRIA